MKFFTIYCFILFIFQTNSQWEGPYRIRGVGSNRCLDISGSHRHNGRRLQIWDCHNGANQKWYINKRTRQFRIGSKHGKCLDVHGGHYNRRRNGAKLQAWTCHRGQNQRFRFSGKHIRAQGKMEGKCLDVWRASRNRGQKVILWPCHRGSNQQWKLEYVGRHKQPRPNKRCPNILIEKRGRTRPRKNYRLGHINFENNMIISLDVTIKAWPRHHWGNILHCGNRNTIRQPGLWINRNGKYFHVVYGTTRNWNQLKNTGRLQLNKKYTIQWRIFRDRYDVYIDGRRWYSVRGRHHNHQRQQCYLGDPWHEAANVIVENLKIIRGTDPSGGCPRKKLRCPRGTRTIGRQGQRNDIGGCGLGGCNSRYSVRSIHSCKAKCQRNRQCKSFSWAPKGGDKNHRNRNVCTIYDKNRPNNKWGPNQIMCGAPRRVIRKRRRRRRKTPRKRRRKRRRKKRRKRRRKKYAKWKCSKSVLGDRYSKQCIRRRIGASKGRFNRQIRRWYRRMRKRGYGGFTGLGKGFRRGYSIGKRDALRRIGQTNGQNNNNNAWNAMRRQQRRARRRVRRRKRRGNNALLNMLMKKQQIKPQPKQVLIQQPVRKTGTQNVLKSVLKDNEKQLGSEVAMQNQQTANFMQQNNNEMKNMENVMRQDQNKINQLIGTVKQVKLGRPMGMRMMPRQIDIGRDSYQSLYRKYLQKYHMWYKGAQGLGPMPRPPGLNFM